MTCIKESRMHCVYANCASEAMRNDQRSKCWVDMEVSWNEGTPTSSILMGFSIISQPFWGTSILGNPHMDPYGKSGLNCGLLIFRVWSQNICRLHKINPNPPATNQQPATKPTETLRHKKKLRKARLVHLKGWHVCAPEKNVFPLSDLLSLGFGVSSDTKENLSPLQEAWELLFSTFRTGPCKKTHQKWEKNGRRIEIGKCQCTEYPAPRLEPNMPCCSGCFSCELSDVASSLGQAQQFDSGMLATSKVSKWQGF